MTILTDHLVLDALTMCRDVCNLAELDVKSLVVAVVLILAG